MGGREGGGGGKAVLKGRGVISSSLVGEQGLAILLPEKKSQS